MSYKVKFLCLRFSLPSVLLLFCLFVVGQKKVGEIDSRFEPVEQLFKQNQKLLGNDYVALVWKDGKIIYQKQGSPDFTAKMQAPIAGAADSADARRAERLDRQRRVLEPVVAGTAGQPVTVPGGAGSHRRAVRVLPAARRPAASTARSAVMTPPPTAAAIGSPPALTEK